jgi:hypothetical protein
MDVIIPFHCIESASIHFYQDTIFAFYTFQQFLELPTCKASCDRLGVSLARKDGDAASRDKRSLFRELFIEVTHHHVASAFENASVIRKELHVRRKMQGRSFTDVLKGKRQRNPNGARGIRIAGGLDSNTVSYCDGCLDPRPDAGNSDFSLLAGGITRLLSDEEGSTDANKPEYADACTYGCDPVQALGCSRLLIPIALFSGASFTFCGYVSGRGLVRRPFGWLRLFGWFGMVVAGSVFVLSVLPYMVAAIWAVV